MKRAEPSDWKTQGLPVQRTTIPLDRVFPPEEMEHIRLGLVPEEMEDKWFVYWLDDVLHFHRSWTGFCIYVVRFVAEGDSYRMIAADANRDPEQYSVTDDQHDRDMISYLIDVLLLRRDAVFPSDETDPGERALSMWSEVGQAMLGEHPGAHDSPRFTIVRGDHMPLEANSVQLVAPQGDAKGFDKTYQEKWLIYCPAIADDTLLYMITALESYSIRSYGGHLGVNTAGLHVEGIHTTGDFMANFHPDKLYEVSGREVAVTKSDDWADFIAGKWKIYSEKHGL